jgi:hypothetical protein
MGGIVECGRPAGGSYVVNIDEPEVTMAAFGKREEVLSFLRKLQFILDEGFVGYGAQLRHDDLRFSQCVNRKPAIDGADFTDASLVESLYNTSTVIEIWGALDVEKRGGERSSAIAQIDYLLVPMRYAANQHEPVPSGLLRITYPESGAPATDDFVELLARPHDIDAFVAAALGYKALREHKFELAHGSLCQASLLLSKLEHRVMSSLQKQQVAELRAFALSSAGSAVERAVADHAYRGSLRLLGAQSICPANTAESKP